MAPLIAPNRSLKLLPFAMFLLWLSLSLGPSCQLEAERIQYTVINNTNTTINVVFFTSEFSEFRGDLPRLPESYESLSVGEVETSLQQCSIPFCSMPPEGRESDSYQIMDAYEDFFVARDSTTAEILFKQRLTYDEFKARDWTMRITDQR